ncbi:MAG: Glu/Leu/Phe/Val dehydrogenase dimerization domain-containing protein [Acidobacteriota bacterium]|nr:leucine dehydrogenase [Blastocatellia bacterium]MDW8239897.1 Glu/Leu/Phe/Val dehydrogenase dimerization domain-containing protein [Acidobacteriota bacterium]
MTYFTAMEELGHEQIVFCQNKDVGLRAIIAIHDTTLGPALGGTRMWPYKSEEEALTDALRLSRGMTYKSAAAGLNLGGGKAVIIGDPRTDKSEALFRAFGRFIESLKGRFITGEDVGIDVNDVEYMYMETKYVCGLSQAHGGGGDPGPVTAYGVLQGIKACVLERYGTDSLSGMAVAIQGLGSVGMHLAKLLNDERVKLFGTDIDEAKVKQAAAQLPIEIVSPDEIYQVPAQIFAPCALGAIINDQTIPQMKFTIIAGAANNQLDEPRHGLELHRREILYAPDYVINAGGLINVFVELEGYDRDRALRMTRGIFYNLRKVFHIARRENLPTYQAADKLVEERIAMVRHLKGMYTGQHLHRYRWEMR